MISFEAFSMEDGVPIYQQIILFLKRGIASGAVRDGDELPSRRALSALLGVNPNTVQKACHLLEQEGLMESRSGSKSCICLSPHAAETVRRELLESDVRGIVGRLHHMGLTRGEAVALIEQYWEG